MPQMKKVLHLKSSFKANASNVTTRNIYGTEHIVVEGVGSMICDTVMNGILYPKEAIIDLANNTMGDIHSPSSHPSDQDGNFILAGTPEAIHQNYVGAFSFNYRMKGDRLIHDLAIDPEKASMSEDGREILDRINNRQDIDTSTGLLIFDFEECTGYGACGTPYNGKANKMSLDHDAILLRETGAATTKQGVGVFANSKNDEKVDVEEFEVNASIANRTLDIVDIDFNEAEALERIKEFTNSTETPSSNYRRFFLDFDRNNSESFDAYNMLFADIVDGKPVAIKSALDKYKADLETNESEDKQYMLNTVDMYLSKIQKKDSMIGNAWKAIKGFLFGNEASHRDIQDQIYDLINKDNEDGYMNYPVDIFDEYFIFEKKGGILLKQWYNLDNNKVILSGEPEEVTRKIIYSPKESSEMKEMIIAALNAAGVSTEGLSDEQLLAAHSALDSDKGTKEEKQVEVNSDIETLIANKLKEALKPLEEKLAANANQELEKLADEVVAADLGIDKEDAMKMSVNSLNGLLAKHGKVAFNAKTDVQFNSEAADADIPE